MSDLELKKLARRGIPAAFRSHIWAQALHLAQIKADNPGKFAQLLATPSDNDHVRGIEKDLDRTFINHPAFHLSPMVSRLRRVLVAFAAHNPHIGYCQSLNFLAGYLLLFFGEEDAFWLMVTLVNTRLPPEYFTDSMMGLHVDLNVLNAVIRTHLPRLHAHLSGLSVDIRPISFPWFLSVFIKTLPIESTLRVWDSFVLEGSKVLFRTALALLSLNEERICRVTNFGQLYSLISVMGATEFDCDRLMEEGFTMRGISKTTIDRMRKKERKIMMKELEETKKKQEARASANAAAAAAAAAVASGTGGGVRGEGGGGGAGGGASRKGVAGPSASDEDEGNWTEDEEDELENSFSRRSRSSTSPAKGDLRVGPPQAGHQQPPTEVLSTTVEPPDGVTQI